MEIRPKIQNAFQRIKQISRLKLLVFFLAGLIILVLILEGSYFFYLRFVKEEALIGGAKSSSILGRELAAKPQEATGVRELSNGLIGVQGYFVSQSANYLVMKVKEKEVMVEVDSETTWRKVSIKELSIEEEEWMPDIIDPESVKEGDYIDALCQKTNGDLRAIGVMTIYE